jgi:excinuclease UvrABC ATPase subunit
MQHPLQPLREAPEEWLVAEDARLHNLQGVSVQIPLNRLTVVTGVSGSGKSSLVRDVIRSNLSRVVQGKARPRRAESSDTVEAIKVRMDTLSSGEIPHRGMAGLADCLWTLVA